MYPKDIEATQNYLKGTDSVSQPPPVLFQIDRKQDTALNCQMFSHREQLLVRLRFVATGAFRQLIVVVSKFTAGR